MLTITEPNQEAISYRNRSLDAGISFSKSSRQTKGSSLSATPSLSTTGSLVDLENPLIDPSFNISGNYTNYVTNALASIIEIRRCLKTNIKFKSEQEPEEQIPSSKKLLVLDLDETLVHADFEGIFLNYDIIITFTCEGISHSVGVFLRPGVNDFLQILKEQYDICIYTASSSQYADAVIDYLDPEKIIVTKRLYRDDCINIGNRLFIKDLSIFAKEYMMKDIVIVDNSMYSFMNNISNGILINSFYYNKSDLELYSVMNYLIDLVAKSDDVREVNASTFNFSQIMEEIEKEI